MFTVGSSSLIDSVRLGELDVDNLHETPILKGTFMLINSKNNQSLGRSMRNQWSEETMAAFEALAKSMEHDMAVDLFGVLPAGGAETVVTEGNVSGF